MLAACFVCGNNSKKDFVAFNCECKVVLCCDCGVNIVATQKSTYRKGLSCVLCGLSSDNIKGIDKCALEEEELVVCGLEHHQLSALDRIPAARQLYAKLIEEGFPRIFKENFDADADGESASAMSMLTLGLARLICLEKLRPFGCSNLLPLGPLRHLDFVRDVELEQAAKIHLNDELQSQIRGLEANYSTMLNICQRTSKEMMSELAHVKLELDFSQRTRFDLEQRNRRLESMLKQLQHELYMSKLQGHAPAELHSPSPDLEGLPLPLPPQYNFFDSQFPGPTTSLKTQYSSEDDDGLPPPPPSSMTEMGAPPPHMLAMNTSPHSHALYDADIHNVGAGGSGYPEQMFNFEMTGMDMSGRPMDFRGRPALCISIPDPDYDEMMKEAAMSDMDSTVMDMASTGFHTLKSMPVGSKNSPTGTRKRPFACRNCPNSMDGKKNNHRQTTHYCVECRVPLHPQCFSQYHKSNKRKMSKPHPIISQVVDGVYVMESAKEGKKAALSVKQVDIITATPPGAATDADAGAGAGGDAPATPSHYYASKAALSMPSDELTERALFEVSQVVLADPEQVSAAIPSPLAAIPWPPVSERETANDKVKTEPVEIHPISDSSLSLLYAATHAEGAHSQGPPSARAPPSRPQVHGL